MAKTVMTPIGVLNFANLFEARAYENGKPRFSCILLFDKMAVQSTAYQALRAGVMEAATEKWGAAKASDASFMRSIRLPFRPAAEKDYAGFDKGEIYISPWSNADQKPGIIDLHGNKIEVPSDVWAGQLARATVRPFAYDTSGNKGIAFGLEHVQIVKADMERLDGRRDASSAFAGADNSDLARYGVDPNAPAAAPDSLPF